MGDGWLIAASPSQSSEAGNDDSGMEADRGSSNFLRQDDKTQDNMTPPPPED
jgi:hypothetical protein